MVWYDWPSSWLIMVDRGWLYFMPVVGLRRPCGDDYGGWCWLWHPQIMLKILGQRVFVSHITIFQYIYETPTMGYGHHIARLGNVCVIAMLGNVCHIATLGFCTSPCDNGLFPSHYYAFKCLWNYDARKCMYSIRWCYGSSHSDNKSMCTKLKCYKVYYNVTNEIFL